MHPRPVFRSLKSRASFPWPAPNRYAIIRSRRPRVATYARKGQGRTPDTPTTVGSAHRVIRCVGQSSEIIQKNWRDNGDTPLARVYTCMRARMRPRDRETYFSCVTVVTREKLKEFNALSDTLPDTPDFPIRVRPEKLCVINSLRDTPGEKGCF